MATPVTFAQTAVINKDGALLLSELNWNEGAAVELCNLETGQSCGARVVRSAGTDSRRFYVVGVELIAPQNNFWGSYYSAADARAASGPH